MKCFLAHFLFSLLLVLTSMLYVDDDGWSFLIYDLGNDSHSLSASALLYENCLKAKTIK